jgi:hypothetical protein
VRHYPLLNVFLITRWRFLWILRIMPLFRVIAQITHYGTPRIAVETRQKGQLDPRGSSKWPRVTRWRQAQGELAVTRLDQPFR